MKNYVLIVMAAATMLLSSCEKEKSEPTGNGGGGSSAPQCEVNEYGWIRFDNNTGDPYKMYIDGSYYGIVSSGDQSSAYEVNEGVHEYRVVQASGYIFTPTEHEYSFYISACESFNLEFP